MKDPKQIMREKITKLEKEIRALRANNFNTILRYINEADHHLDRLSQYAQELNGCEPIYLKPETEKRHGFGRMDMAWTVAGVMERLQAEHKVLEETVEADGKAMDDLKKEHERYRKQYPPVKAV